MGAHDDLILAATLNDLQHAIGFLEHIGVCLADILQFKAQTGNTMGYANDI